MKLQWKNLIRANRTGSMVHIIWATEFPNLFEIHVPFQGKSNLYVDGRLLAASRDIIKLADRAQDQCDFLQGESFNLFSNRGDMDIGSR